MARDPLAQGCVAERLAVTNDAVLQRCGGRFSDEARRRRARFAKLHMNDVSALALQRLGFTQHVHRHKGRDGASFGGLKGRSHIVL